MDDVAITISCHHSSIFKSVLPISVFLLVASLGRAQPQEQRPLGVIDFFGSKGVNVDAVRMALPVHVGDQLPAQITPSVDLQENVAAAVRQAIGRDATDVGLVCCDDRQRWILFIGLPGASSRPIAYRLPPVSSMRLPKEVLQLDAEWGKAWMDAAAAGATEDDSQGFALSSDPVLRSKQMAMREYAIGNEALLKRALEQSSDARHRAIAATALGYANASAGQVSALVQASRDPNEGVRNNAVRSLAVIARAKPELARQIDARAFIRLLTSGSWSDRNKGAMILMVLTERRDPAMLRELRANALDALVEMARWSSPGHAYFARVLVGRIAGIEEPRLQQLVKEGRGDEIIAAIR